MVTLAPWDIKSLTKKYYILVIARLRQDPIVPPPMLTLQFANNRILAQ